MIPSTQDRLNNIFATTNIAVQKDRRGKYTQHRIALSDDAYATFRTWAPSIRLISGTINYLLGLNFVPALWRDNRPDDYRNGDTWQREDGYCPIWTDPVVEQRRPRYLALHDTTLDTLAKLSGAFEIGISQWASPHNAVRHTRLSTLLLLPVHARASVALQAIGEGFLVPHYPLPPDKVELRRLASPYPKWAYTKG